MTTRCLLRVIRALIGLVGATALAQARLDWTEKTLNRTARSSDETVEGVFHFTNRGAAPVTIGEIETSCSCTAAALDKRVYAPGESGKITALLTIGGHMGEVTNTLRVVTDSADDPATVLIFHVEVEAMFSIEPRFAYWQRNAPPDPQTIAVRAKADTGFRLKSIQAPPGAFRAHLIEETPGKAWRIEVSPTATTLRTSLTLLVKTVGPNGVEKDYPVLMRVL